MPGSASFVSRPGGQINPQRPLEGVRYITEDLVSRSAGGKPLDSITILNLSHSSISGKKIKYIESLDRAKRVHTLTLAHNCIEKIERLEALVKLKDLDLSYNVIHKVEGLEKLTTLISLNLEGNQLETLPLWLPKKLKNLRNLKLAFNHINNLQEFRKLRSLVNLTYLTASDNPVAELAHYRLYLIFHLRSLDVLDGKRVTDEERDRADRRFAQEEIDVLQKELNTTENKLEGLKDEHNKSVNELESSRLKDRQLSTVNKDKEKVIQQLQAELEMKQELVHAKSAELSRANRKHYELEQELAFFKIDTKFTSLAQKPDTPSMEGESLEESPYIGKARHTKNKPDWPHSLKARKVARGPPRSDSLSSDSESVPRPGPSLRDPDMEAKQQQVADAEKRLSELEENLKVTEERVATASDYLVKLTDLVKAQKPRVKPESDSEKAELESELEQKNNNIRELEAIIDRLNDKLNDNDDDVSDTQNAIRDINDELDNPGLDAVTKENLQIELEGQEEKLVQLKDVASKMEEALGNAEDSLTNERASARVIEDRLNTSPSPDEGDQSEPELDVRNLAAEVKGMLQSGRDTKSENHRLRQELEALRQELTTLDQEAAEGEETRRHLATLEQQLQAQDKANAQLLAQLEESNRLDDSRGSVDQGVAAELKAELAALRDEKELLKDALEQAEASAQSENPRKKKELQFLKRENERLARELSNEKSAQQAEALAVIDDLLENVEAGQPFKPDKNADPVTRKLAALQNSFTKQLKDREREQRQSKEENKKLQQELANVSRALSEQEHRDYGSTDTEAASLIDHLKNEMDELKERLEDEQVLKGNLDQAGRTIRKLQAQLDAQRKAAERSRDQSPGVPRSRGPTSKSPPRFNIDESYDDTDSLNHSRDTVQFRPSERPPTKHPAPVDPRSDSRLETRRGDSRGDNRSTGHRADSRLEPRSDTAQSHSRSSGRVTSHDDLPRSAGPRQAPRANPHPDEQMSFMSEAPRMARGPERPDFPDSARPADAPNEFNRDKRWARGKKPGLGDIRETYESESDKPKAPRDPEMKRLVGQLRWADDEIASLRRSLRDRELELEDEMRNTNMADETIDKQKDELDKLLDELDWYKNEVERLYQALANRQPLSEVDYERIADLPRSVIESQRAVGDHRRNLANKHPTYGQPGQSAPISHPQPNQTSYPSQQPFQEQSQLGESFIQGPTFRPGDSSQPANQILTSTPYRGQGHGHLQPVQQLPQLAYQQPVTQAMAASYSAVPSGIQVSAPVAQPVGSVALLQPSTTLVTTAQPAAVQTVVPTTLVQPTTTLVQAVSAPATPTRTVVVQTSAPNTPVKSILKTRGPTGGLICQIPEHHDLEDQLARMRDRYKNMKSISLKSQSVDERMVEKKFTAQVKAAKSLKSALKDRKGELESLDLAITEQRAELAGLKGSLASQSRERLAAQENVERQAEIEHYMSTELSCIEETLSRRRAELKEADSRLAACRRDIDSAHIEAHHVVTEYEATQERLEVVGQQLETLADRKHTEEEEVAQLLVDRKSLTADKLEAEEQLMKISAIISEKDGEFNSLTSRINQSQAVLAELQATIRQQTQEAERRLAEIKAEAETHLHNVQRSETELADYYGDMQDIRSVLTEREKQLAEANNELGASKQQLSLVSAQAQERSDKVAKLESHLENTNKLIQDRHSELSSLSQIEREMKERLESRKRLLSKVKDKVNEEKENLQSLSLAVDQKEEQLSVLKKTLNAARTESSELLREISERKSQLDSMNAEVGVTEQEVMELRGKQSEARTQLDKLQFENSTISAVVDNLKTERETLQANINKTRLEIEQQDARLQHVQEKYASTEKEQSDLESEVRQRAAELDQLSNRLRQLQRDVDDATYEKTTADEELSTTNTLLKEKKTSMSRVKKHLRDMDDKSIKLQTEIDQLDKEKASMERELDSVKDEYQHISGRLAEGKSVVEELHQSAAELRQDIARLEEDRTERQHSLKDLTVQYEREGQQFNNLSERAERELAHAKEQQRVCENRVGELTAELHRLMNEITKSRQQYGDLNAIREKLITTERELDNERVTNSELTKQLSEFTHRLQSRSDSLTKVKHNAEHHVTSLSSELSHAKKELRQQREKTRAEIEDLELIAQQHAQRSERLDRELTMARDQINKLNQVISQQESKQKLEEKLDQTIADLKQGLHEEVTSGLSQLDRSRGYSDAELEELRAQKSYIANEVVSLKENLSKIHGRTLSCQTPTSLSPVKSSIEVGAASSAIRKRYAAEQEAIRARMLDQMRRHLDSMEDMKQHSMDVLNGLQDRVSNLQGVLNESTSYHQNLPSPPQRDNKPY